MRSDRLRCRRDQSAVLVIDVQERLHPVMEEGLRGQVEANLPRLLQAASALGVPVIATEQYPKGLGSTLGLVKEHLGLSAPIPKLSFDALGEPRIEQALLASERGSFVVCGMEAHICVFQTVRSLRERGHPVFVLADAVASRTRQNHEIGLSLAREAGALVTSIEALLFDWVEAGGSDDFKLVSRLVR